MGPEAKLFKKLKKATPRIIWNRIENLSLPGMPDLLGYNTNHHFFTVELKVTKSNSVRFSLHQIAFHKLHPKNSFILVKHLASSRVKLYEGSRIRELAACGFKLEACSLQLIKIWAFNHRLNFHNFLTWAIAGPGRYYYMNDQFPDPRSIGNIVIKPIAQWIRDQLLSCAGGLLILALKPLRPSIATCTIAVNIPQLQHLIPDPSISFSIV